MEPCQASKRKPTVGLQKVGHVLRAPGGEFVFPAPILGESLNRDESARNHNQDQRANTPMSLHGRDHTAAGLLVGTCEHRFWTAMLGGRNGQVAIPFTSHRGK